MLPKHKSGHELSGVDILTRALNRHPKYGLSNVIREHAGQAETQGVVSSIDTPARVRIPDIEEGFEFWRTVGQIRGVEDPTAFAKSAVAYERAYARKLPIGRAVDEPEDPSMSISVGTYKPGIGDGGSIFFVSKQPRPRPPQPTGRWAQNRINRTEYLNLIRKIRKYHPKANVEFVRQQNAPITRRQLRDMQDYLANLDRNADRTNRSKPGWVTITGRVSPPLKRGRRWLRGTHGNAGFVPREIVRKLVWRRFRNFDAMRGAFWREVAKNPKTRAQFSTINVREMEAGRAPFVHKTQAVRGRKRHELHHIRPTSRGDGAYDLSNIVVVTPRTHLEILSPSYHFWKK